MGAIDLVQDPHDPRRLYASTWRPPPRGSCTPWWSIIRPRGVVATTYIFRSTDRGETWQSIVGNLPAEPVNVIAEDPVHPEILYLGTDLGVFASLDRGASWVSLCGDLPTVAVFDLAVHPRSPT